VRIRTDSESLVLGQDRTCQDMTQLDRTVGRKKGADEASTIDMAIARPASQVTSHRGGCRLEWACLTFFLVEETSPCVAGVL
jgi:hypothetical protein